MNREIKFRAWDGEEMVGWDFLEKVSMDWWTAYQAVMQFTGLLDKNGTEIYEGDIVEYSALLDVDKKCRSQVRWSDSGFIANGAMMKSQLYEVIGNIYEITRRHTMNLTFSPLEIDANDIPFQQARDGGLSIRKYPKNYVIAEEIEGTGQPNDVGYSQVIKKIPVDREDELEDFLKHYESYESRANGQGFNRSNMGDIF